MDILKITQKLKELGFDDAAAVNPKELELLPEVRGMCADNRCGAYGKKWSCPPNCGTLEYGLEKFAQYNNGVVMLSVTKLEDSYDFEGMEQAGERHKKLFLDAIALAKEEYSNILPLGAGACTICKECTCPDAPCRFPDQMIVSMEAYGLLVSRVCEQCGLNYFNGEATVTYVSAILF